MRMQIEHDFMLMSVLFNPLVTELCFSLIFDMYLKIDSYRLPIHKRDEIFPIIIPSYFEIIILIKRSHCGTLVTKGKRLKSLT